MLPKVLGLRFSRLQNSLCDSPLASCRSKSSIHSSVVNPDLNLRGLAMSIARPPCVTRTALQSKDRRDRNRG